MKTKSAILEQTSEALRSSNHPLLICHVAPDGDAIGSLTGLGRALRQMGQEPTVACSDPILPQFLFIPGAEAIVQEVDTFFDVVIALDCSDLERLGHFPRTPAFANKPLINIDHHVTNTGFGDLNLVDTRAASTAGIVLQLLEAMAAPLDTEIATSLLTGIVADTRGFRTGNVTTADVEAAVRLMKAGASLTYIARHALDRRHVSAIRLWGAALALLEVRDRVIWTSIPQVVARRVDYTGDGDAGLVSFLISADDVDVAVVFVERGDGRVEVGLRAVPGFDVAQVASQLGGGGHTLAAGCAVPGSLEEVQAKVLGLLQHSLAQQRQNHD